MKFTNNRKKAVNLSARSSGRYNWENASVVFEKEIRKYNKKENDDNNKAGIDSDKEIKIIDGNGVDCSF